MLPEKMPLFLSRDELHVLMSVIDNPGLADLVNFAVNTGCRQGEVINLRWSRVDLVKRRLILENRGYMTKSQKIRSIPLNKAATELLARRKKELNCEFVFTLEGVQVEPNKMNKEFKKFIRKAKLNPLLYFHSLRHSFALYHCINKAT